MSASSCAPFQQFCDPVVRIDHVYGHLSKSKDNGMIPLSRSIYAALFLTLSIASPVSVVAQDVYRIGPGDILNLRVLEWEPVSRVLQDWPAMTADYAVGIDGMVNVPFLGAVQAEGRTAQEIGMEIADGLQNRFALPERPDATVEIVGYQPVVVIGLVRAPGQFDYRPGLSAQHAVGLAGGLLDDLVRGSESARELLNSEGALALLEDQRERLLVLRARLEAERDQVPFPEIVPGIVSGNVATALIAAEKAILDVRRDNLRRELEAVEDQKILIAAEIETLEAKQAALIRQQELAQGEMENVESLADRGLVANARLFEVERMLVTVENQALDVSTALLEARQNLATTESDKISLLDTRFAEIVTEGQLVDAELSEIERKITTQRALSSQLLAITRTIGDPTVAGVEIVIHRHGEMLRNAATEPLLPGDIVDVVLPGTTLN
jgi:polysaccharide biosynthesis/export protein ExoF